MKLKRNANFVCCLAMFILPFTTASAALSDDKQPLKSEADQATINNKTGITVLTGHAVVNQGSRHLKGNTITVYRNKHGEVTKMVAKGTPAYYQARLDPNKPMLQGEAHSIEYNKKLNKLILEQKASLNQGGDSYAGPHLEYSIREKMVTSIAKSKGRTTIILSPRGVPGASHVLAKASRR